MSRYNQLPRYKKIGNIQWIGSHDCHAKIKIIDSQASRIFVQFRGFVCINGHVAIKVTISCTRGTIRIANVTNRTVEDARQDPALQSRISGFTDLDNAIDIQVTVSSIATAGIYKTICTNIEDGSVGNAWQGPAHFAVTVHIIPVRAAHAEESSYVSAADSHGRNVD